MKCASCGAEIKAADLPRAGAGGGVHMHDDCVRALVERVSRLEAAPKAEPFARQIAAMREQLTEAGFTDQNVEQALREALETLVAVKEEAEGAVKAEDHKHELLMEACGERDQAMKREREAVQSAAAVTRLLRLVRDWAGDHIDIVITQPRLEDILLAVPDALKADAGKGLVEAGKKLDAIWAILAADGRPPIVEAVQSLVEDLRAAKHEATNARSERDEAKRAAASALATVGAVHAALEE